MIARGFKNTMRNKILTLPNVQLLGATSAKWITQRPIDSNVLTIIAVDGAGNLGGRKWLLSSPSLSIQELGLGESQVGSTLIYVMTGTRLRKCGVAKNH